MGSIISAGINQVTSLAGNAVDYVMNKETNHANERINNHTNDANLQIARETNEANKAINQANIDYQNAYNQQIFEREDTAFQRMAKDASAVGINPLAISQGSPSGGTASAPQASIPMQGATMQDYRRDPFRVSLPDVSSLANITSEINTLMTGIAQRDILHEQAVKAKNENDFFAENGYYPAPPTDFERFLTGAANLIEGKGAISNHVDTLKEGVKNKVDDLKDSFTDKVVKPLSNLKSKAPLSTSAPVSSHSDKSYGSLYSLNNLYPSNGDIEDYETMSGIKMSADNALNDAWNDLSKRIKRLFKRDKK